jgi:hypothetical protein
MACVLSARGWAARGWAASGAAAASLVLVSRRGSRNRDSDSTQQVDSPSATIPQSRQVFPQRPKRKFPWSFHACIRALGGWSQGWPQRLALGACLGGLGGLALVCQVTSHGRSAAWWLPAPSFAFCAACTVQRSPSIHSNTVGTHRGVWHRMHPAAPPSHLVAPPSAWPALRLGHVPKSVWRYKSDLLCSAPAMLLLVVC